MNELLERATKEKAEGLLLVIGCEPMIKKHNAWEPMNNDIFKHSDWSGLVNAFLPDSLQVELEKSGQSSVWGKKFDTEMTLSFYQNENVSKAVIDFVPSPESLQKENSAVHPLFQDILLREKGLSLLVGAKDSMNSILIQSLLCHLNEKKSTHVVVIGSEVIAPIKKGKAQIVSLSNSCWTSARSSNFVHGADVVIFNGANDPKLIVDALQLSETGINVLFSFSANSILNGLRQVYSSLPQNSYRHYVSRFAEVFTGMMCRYRLRSHEDENIFAHEVLMNKPTTTKWIESEDLASIKDYLHQTNETPGVVSLNQSLLQLIIRRKIEIKTAFRWTNDPEHLDHLMKKIGI